VDAKDLLSSELVDARKRFLALIDDLPDEALEVPRLAILNPPLWEAGHVAWFAEKWTLRRLGGRAPLRANGDTLWDSSTVEHDTRWDLPLPSRKETLAYMGAVLDRIIERLQTCVLDEREVYFHRHVTFHEDMHAEAMILARQVVGMPIPRARGGEAPPAGPCPGDVHLPGGTFELGAYPDAPFVFDNEKWAHTVTLAPFDIARAPVTQAEFREFVDAGGYERDEFWSAEGLHWRNGARARHPQFWRPGADGAWMRAHFDRLVPLEEHKPVHHVNWHEAQAFCKFAGRRLPTEAEWEFAACHERSGQGSRKPRFPWGDAVADPARAHLDLRSDSCADVGACAAGDSADGCRQMIGNVWEWTASDFQPYPGFVADPYREYSQPWFGTHKVLRGGSFATPARLLRNTWRNFYKPDRRDVIAGFRTVSDSWPA
jgi:gamma-glutamyl hercynylcysteine S-oxide synthase